MKQISVDPELLGHIEALLLDEIKALLFGGVRERLGEFIQW